MNDNQAARTEKLIAVGLFLLFLLSILTPSIVYPLAQKALIVGPIIGILLPAISLFLWGRFGPSPINGMLNGLISLIVVFFNLFSIGMSIISLLRHLAAK